ncbi:hypothetical protein ERJ75_001386300 [Trypanosoma vivax]|nr:hypothetical protein ERJ75_001386300 [Trypanosoma vivax]
MGRPGAEVRTRAALTTSLAALDAERDRPSARALHARVCRHAATRGGTRLLAWPNGTQWEAPRVPRRWFAGVVTSSARGEWQRHKPCASGMRAKRQPKLRWRDERTTALAATGPLQPHRTRHSNGGAWICGGTREALAGASIGNHAAFFRTNHTRLCARRGVAVDPPCRNAHGSIFLHLAGATRKRSPGDGRRGAEQGRFTCTDTVRAMRGKVRGEQQASTAERGLRNKQHAKGKQMRDAEHAGRGRTTGGCRRLQRWMPRRRASSGRSLGKRATQVARATWRGLQAVGRRGKSPVQ